jgi:hypothetical protein
VTPAAPVQAPGKKTDDKSFFDVSNISHCLFKGFYVLLKTYNDSTFV